MKIGSVCSGIGGLELGLALAGVDADVAWFVEVEPACRAVLSRWWPGVPIFEDVTTIDWTKMDPVDILTGGYPCQPFSVAGKRKGTSDERHLWPFVWDAIRVLRPGIAFLENVPGHLSSGFDVVQADLAAIGFNAEWNCLSASSVGAPHRRDRLWILASDADRGNGGPGGSRGSEHDDQDLPVTVGAHVGPSSDPEGDGIRPGLRASGSRRVRRGRPGHGDGGSSSDTTVQGSSVGTIIEGLPEGPPAERSPVRPFPWGRFEPAIQRWEAITGRPAPYPLNGRGTMLPAFVEWMMGFPNGWTSQMSRIDALKALGNAVVPPAAARAFQILIRDSRPGSGHTGRE